MTVDTTGHILDVRGVQKRFGGVVALHDVALALRPGERHAVVGENGAGKSTLMRIVAGILAPDSGEVLIDGQPVGRGATAALDAGIALVHQELSLVPELSVAENIDLGNCPTRYGFVRRREQREHARAALAEIGVDLDLSEPVGRLSVAARQFVEIARAVARRPRVLILDEPTATLTPSETSHLLGLLGRLSDQGIAILYISHRIPEIFELCESATVLRDGHLVARPDLADITGDELVDLMVGRELAKDLRTERRERAPGEVVLRARDVSAAKVRHVDLEVRAGQIVGLGGLVGSGRSEIVRAVVGADPRTSGTVELRTGDQEWTPLRSYARAVRLGVAYVPEERRAEGLALGMTVADNIALPSRGRLNRLGVMRHAAMASLAQDVIGRVGLQPPWPRHEAGQFSGGNQQKIVIGKWLAGSPRLVVLDEPTRGVDVGAKAEIHQLVRELADDGAAVLLVSSDLPELLDLSDTVHVVRDGRVVGTLGSQDATESAVMRLAAGKEEQIV
ncbi:sugar ABC transporter ATP-binding protein [Streptomyces sp. NPDC005840]|uniref:sugar ABC transporter ATP-binding protein n=1 Tax=Streptomyces sp. NPDC005840 TaxID=3157072 RepID=UPI0033C281E3